MPRNIDPRIQRTRALVRSAVSSLLVEGGLSAVTFSSVASRSGLGRQTLYRHWNTVEELVVDSVLEGVDDGYPSAALDAADALRQWILGLTRALSEEPRATALAYVVALAQLLDRLLEDRRQALISVLAPFERTCPKPVFAATVGPPIFASLWAGRPLRAAEAAALATQLEPLLPRRLHRTD